MTTPSLSDAQLRAVTRWVRDALSDLDYWPPDGANLTRLAENCAAALDINVLDQNISDDQDNEVHESVVQWMADWGEEVRP